MRLSKYEIGKLLHYRNGFVLMEFSVGGAERSVPLSRGKDQEEF